MEALVTWGVGEATSKSGNGGDGFAMWPEFSWSYDTRGGQLSVRSGSGCGAPSVVHLPESGWQIVSGRLLGALQNGRRGT